MLQEVPVQRHRYRRRRRFQGKEGLILRPRRQRLTQHGLFGGQLVDTRWHVSQVGTLYPDKDCILFLEDLVPGEGFHHLLMHSLLAVFSWFPLSGTPPEPNTGMGCVDKKTGLLS